MTLALPAVWDRPPPEVVESTAPDVLHPPEPEPPRIPSVAPVRLRTGRRGRLLREVLGEVEALRPVLREAVEQYELRMMAQLAEILRALGGESDRLARMPTVKSSSAMLRAIRAAELKPHRGRPKDLVRLHELVAELTELLPPRG